MNRTGQMSVGVLILFAIAVIVCGAFLPQIASNQGVMTETGTKFYGEYSSLTNTSGDQVLEGQELISTTSIINGSGTIDCSGNITLNETVWSGTNTKRIVASSVDQNDAQYCQYVNITYVAGNEGYVDDSGGRAIAGLIVLTSGLALLGIAIYYFIRQSGWILNI